MYVCSECGAPQPVDGRCPADGTPLAAIGEDVLLGTTIGAYRVARLLGIGGMGRVYKGVHPTIGSRVAIKVLSRECSDRRDLVERFFAEAKAVNLIRHESIVNVLDLATLPDGRPYIIMEYLDGAPLAAIIEHAAQTQPLPLGGLARLAVEVLDALAAAHAKGIVHRDLKPDNIFVTPSGRPKVLDFGIAKLTDLSTGTGGSSTRTGSLLGTPHYMSPEQAAGKSVDHRADLYAIGVILFEASTGQKPFLAESLFDLLRKHVEVPPPPPRSLRPDLPPEVESVILTALAKAPDQRFASAQAMSMALQHATAHLDPSQWTPITGGAGHRAEPTGGWHPTPPASWGGSGRPRESAPPHVSPHAPPAIGHHSTVTAGAVQRVAPSSGSRKGLWLGLGAVLLVGGGVAAGIAASRGSGGGGGGDERKPADDPPAEETAVAPAKAEPAKVEPATPEPATPDPDGDDDDDAAATQAALDDLTKQLGAIDARQLPPAARKQLEELKGLSKLPPKERIARIKQMIGKDGGLDLAGGLAEAFDPLGPGAPAPPSPPTAPPPPSPSPSPPPPAAPGAWVTARELAYPGFNPRRVDLSAFVRWALAEAKRADPAAVLFRIDASGVAPDGTANLELATLASQHGSIDLRFFSPARSQRDPSLPLGVPDRRDRACEFRIEAEPDGVQLRPVSGFDCKRNTAVPAPRCTAAGVWRRAIAAKAPSQAVASLGYRAFGNGPPTWYFDIGFGHDVAYSRTFNDDGC